LSGGSLDGQALKLALVKDGDQWKLDEVVEFTKFNQAKLVENLEASLSEASAEVPRQLGACVVEAFKQSSQAEAEELLFGKTPAALEEVLEACSSSPSA
jgi:hypothetical protein